MSKKAFNCATMTLNLQVMSICVVPVVRHKLSNHTVYTYAMVDICSQATFAKDN